jgi:hypothetical protein
MDKKLARRLQSIQNKIDALEKLKGLLERNPDLVPRTNLKSMESGTFLEFEDRGFIRPRIVDKKPVLVLERYIHEDEDWDQKIVSMDDVSTYDRETLVKTILEGIKVDLNKEPYHYFDEDEEGDVRDSVNNL